MKKLASTLPNMFFSLVGICLVVSGILAYLNSLTSEPIAQAKIQAKNDAIKAVTPKFDNNPYNEAYKVSLQGDSDSLIVYPARLQDRIVGYAIETYSTSGFNGRISIMMGLDTEGKLIDFSVLENNETPGLGSKIMEWFHTPNTKGRLQEMKDIDLKKAHPLKVSQDGGEVDAITAATISSRAFLEAINRGYNAYSQVSNRPQQ